jgi:hypothetical protein
VSRIEAVVIREQEEGMSIKIASPGADIADGVPLDILGPADLSEGAEFSIRFTGGKSRSGKVIRLEDAGARAVIEVQGGRWRLHRRDAKNMGGIIRYPWAVGGREI